MGSCVNSYIVHSSLHSKTFIGETDELGLVYSGKSLGDKTHLELKKDQNYENFLEQHVHDKANRGITGGIKSTSAVPWSQRERGGGRKTGHCGQSIGARSALGNEVEEGHPNSPGSGGLAGVLPKHGCFCSHFPTLMIIPQTSLSI